MTTPANLPSIPGTAAGVLRGGAARPRRFRWLLATAFLSMVLPARDGAADHFAPECEADGSPVVVGSVACRRIDSTFLGAVTAFSYYVPPACGEPGRQCPVLYLLHGTGSSYRTMLGTVDGELSSRALGWVPSLTSGPPVDPRDVPDPWTYADLSTWVPKPSIDLIYVAPHNLTLPHGFGPAPGTDGLWSDWNPRYALGGDSEAYPTPPPRFESFLVRELIPYVETNLPAGSGRGWRAIDGRSQGGVGAAKIGLQYPDIFASVGSISGGASPFTGGGTTAAHTTARAVLPDGIAVPVETAYVPLPGIVSESYPGENEMPVEDNLITTALRGIFFAWGDPVADEAYHRAQNPKDIAINGRARDGDEPSIQIRIMINDSVPRRGADDLNPTDFVFEWAALAGSVEVSKALEAEGVEHLFQLNPGTHDPVYHRPFYRQLLEEHYARLRHRDGSGDPPPAPTRFDYRSVLIDFSVWGWRFELDRKPVEFLNLYDVSCSGLTLQGSGRVTVTVPAACGTGHEGAATFEVDLGPSAPTDERSSAGEAGAYGRRVRVMLTAL